MKMPFSFADSLQLRLAEYLPIDAPHPIDIAISLNSPVNKISSVQAWQHAVDLIYRLLMCEVVEIWPADVITESENSEFSVRLLMYCKKLAEVCPYNDEAYNLIEGYGLPWVGPSLCMTGKTRELLKKHDMVWTKREDTWPLNEAFIDDIERIFEAHGVAWSDEPLILIRDDSAKR